MITGPQQQLRILVVEDEPLVAMVIEFAIEELGHDVLGPVGHLQDAVMAASGDDYDCAILDMNIIGGSSHPVAEIFHSKQRPFLLASGAGDRSLPASLQAQPMLSKPYSVQELEDALQLLFAKVVRKA